MCDTCDHTHGDGCGCDDGDDGGDGDDDDDGREGDDGVVVVVIDRFVSGGDMCGMVRVLTLAVNIDPECALFQSLCIIPSRGSPAVNCVWCISVNL